MQATKYIYYFAYDHTESDLCKLESKHLFGVEEANKMLFSERDIQPSTSAFIKKRLDVCIMSEDYQKLLELIKKQNIQIDEFKVEYLVLHNDPTNYPDRLQKLKDIGYSITGDPEYYNPKTSYAVCNYNGIWCFGYLHKNGFDWYKHKQKPFSFSNSINPKVAKALINIASKGDKNKRLLDTCCGVGTILLEACFSGFTIEGSDINWKVCRQSRKNLAHFGYHTNVYRADIQHIIARYDAAIIDLPYNVFSIADDRIILHILQSATQITERLIIVSTTNIHHLIDKVGLSLLNRCEVSKSGKANFTRIVWVCKKPELEK